MKPLILSTTGYALLQKYLFNDTEYLVWLFIVVFIDLLTGVTKAWVTGSGYKDITSTGLRMTIKKLIQYGSFLIVTHVLCNFKIDGQAFQDLTWIENWAYKLLILIEIKSVYENITAISPGLDFVNVIAQNISKIISKVRDEKNTKNEKTNPEN